MLISLERNGGFSGISKVMEIDTAKLPQKKQEKLSMLLETANFFHLPAYIAAEPNQRDRFEYTLSVEDEDKQHTVTVSESAMPEDLKPLIEWITNNS
jgi:hypothetical protein